jgi:hypothetical protein
MLLLTLNSRSNSNSFLTFDRHYIRAGGASRQLPAGVDSCVCLGVQSSRQHLLDKRGLHPLKACHARFNAGDVGPSKARNS